jgi:hypothetical protein
MGLVWILGLRVFWSSRVWVLGCSSRLTTWVTRARRVITLSNLLPPSKTCRSNLESVVFRCSRCNPSLYTHTPISITTHVFDLVHSLPSLALPSHSSQVLTSVLYLNQPIPSPSPPPPPPSSSYLFLPIPFLHAGQTLPSHPPLSPAVPPNPSPSAKEPDNPRRAQRRRL